MFSEFPPVSAAEWRAQLEKDLKGKPLDSLQWEVEAGVTMPPFYAHDEALSPREPFAFRKSGGPWRVAESVTVNDVAAANAQALNALTNGADALFFTLPNGFSDFDKLFNDIRADYIFTAFRTAEPFRILDAWISYTQRQGWLPENLPGALWYSEGDFSYPCFMMAVEKMPTMHSLPVDVSNMRGLSAKAQLSEAIKRIGWHLDQFPSKQGAAANAISVSFGVGNNYLLEIAKLRAFRKMCRDLFVGRGIENPPAVHLHAITTNMSTDPHQNMIAAATQALSAAVGSADSIEVAPSDGVGSEFSLRIARNVQHLLQLESGIGNVEDAAAGSYFLEALTDKLAN